MAICTDCGNRRFCTYPRTESTRFCEEYDDAPLRPEGEQAEWDLKTVLEEWGFIEREAA